jgi:DNA-directed RNA polymerase sigma subunit (sigma70/sigma32)
MKEKMLSVFTEVDMKNVDVASYLRMVKEEEKLKLHQVGKYYSLEESLRKDCSCLLDSIPCNDCSDSGLMRESKSKDFEFALAILTFKQHYVLSSFFGLLGEEQPIENIAKFLKVKTKKVNSIKEKAINRLRNSDGARHLLQVYL